MLFVNEHTAMIKAVIALRMRKKLRISVIFIGADYKGDFLYCQSFIYIFPVRQPC
ncbi:hypothetical protein TREVI0001_0656 [Treponema vincentii ATCC 35580]|uniref:Uncharacterized protein n=1 Tax=Treponema vincentii ATCC 35580 TaxID=596324 RepID=C8PMP1_9SPIR|nr:hypothetical protein TREVI0001_0656 [Treponema vincentii ATCC 35580]